MNKTAIILVVIVVIVGIVFVMKSFDSTPVEPEPTNTAAETSPNALDRIEAAIRAKLRR